MDQLPFPPADDILDIAPRYRELQAEQPVTRVRTAAGDPAWLVTRHEDVTALFGDDRLGRSHPNPEKAARISSSVVLGGPMTDYETERAQHQMLRKLLAPAFSPRRVNALRPRIGRMVEDLLDGLGEPPADWHQAFAVPLPVMVICALLGVPYEDHPLFRGWAVRLTSFDPGVAGRARDDLSAYVRDLLPGKRENPGEDVISDLVAVQGETGMADEHIAMLSAMLLFAGHETTVIRLDLGVLMLLDHPGQLAALRADPALVPGAVEEILRVSSISTTGGVPRYAREDLTVGGADIPAGDALILAPQAANRDPRVFPGPGDFDITRTANPHVTFGHGIHYCVGASLARVELQEAFGRIPSRLPGLRLDVPREELRWRAESLTGGLDALPVRW